MLIGDELDRAAQTRVGGAVVAASRDDSVGEPPFVVAGGALLTRLADDLDGTATAALLSDATGRIVDRRCAGDAVREALDRAGLEPGVTAEFGSTGVTALDRTTRDRTPTVVVGPEHSN